MVIIDRYIYIYIIYLIWNIYYYIYISWAGWYIRSCAITFFILRYPGFGLIQQVCGIAHPWYRIATIMAAISRVTFPRKKSRRKTHFGNGDGTSLRHQNPWNTSWTLIGDVFIHIKLVELTKADHKNKILVRIDMGSRFGLIFFVNTNFNRKRINQCVPSHRRCWQNHPNTMANLRKQNPLYWGHARITSDWHGIETPYTWLQLSCKNQTHHPRARPESSKSILPNEADMVAIFFERVC